MCKRPQPDLELLRRVRDFQGRAEAPVRARDPVSQTRMRDFAESVGDANPIYVDERAAVEAGHGGVVCPPALLQAWTMPGQRPDPAVGPTAELYRLLDEHGFTGLIAVGYAQQYLRYLRPGDRLTAQRRIRSVTPQKSTWLGPAHFISSDTDFVDQHDEAAGRMSWTLMKYQSIAEQRRPSGPDGSGAGSGPVGRSLPHLRVGVTATTIVAGALASNDYSRIHHDREAARTAGAPDIFANILTTCGWVNRYVTDWAGPTARLRSTEFRLGVPTYPGDTLTFSGEVVGEGRDGVAVVHVRATNERGRHATGTVEVSRPAQPPL